MPTGVDDTTIWVNVGSAVSLVGATIGATFVGALAIVKGYEGMDDLVDADVNAQQNGQELLDAPSAARTRLRAEDVLGIQTPEEASKDSQPQPPVKQ